MIWRLELKAKLTQAGEKAPAAQIMGRTEDVGKESVRKFLLYAV